ncbi:MAG: hypothetical protein GYB35_16020 [Algicola sp.]|nr:hypothetical protein [Algicola sp.]
MSLSSKNKFKKLSFYVLPVLLVFIASCTDNSSFTEAEVALLETSEQEELIKQAEIESSKWNFSKAHKLLAEAETKMYAPELIADLKMKIESDQEKYNLEKRLREEKEKERLARLEQQRIEQSNRDRKQKQFDASGNMGGSLNCASVSEDHALYRYCSTGDCSGLSNDYALYQLCSSDSIDGLAGNFGIYKYLKDGDSSGLSQNYKVFKAAQSNSASFSNRKRFIIYLKRGYIYGH